MTTIVLLTISNIFMTLAWYGHLKYREAPLFKVIVVSWGNCVFPILLSGASQSNWLVRVHRGAVEDDAGSDYTNRFSRCFPCSTWTRRSKWNYILGFALIVVAVFVIFKKW